jgi:hypothetical protein
MADVRDRDRAWGLVVHARAQTSDTSALGIGDNRRFALAHRAQARLLHTGVMLADARVVVISRGTDRIAAELAAVGRVHGCGFQSSPRPALRAILPPWPRTIRAYSSEMMSCFFGLQH